MKDEKKIELPNELEKQQSIAFILDQVDVVPRTFLQFIRNFLSDINIKIIFGELKEVLLVIFMTLICVLVLGIQVTHEQMLKTNLVIGELQQDTAFLTFLLSPLVYALFHYLSLWKEYQLKTFELKMTYRISLKELLIIRLLLFSMVALIVSVTSSCLLWLALEKNISLIRLISISSASLFIFATVQLVLDQKISLKKSYIISPIFWLIVGFILFELSNFVGGILIWLPNFLVIIISLVAIASYLYLLRQEFLKQREGGEAYVRA
ncbi:hypothetical protein [Vagococcus hydrophili]|uniref:Uncharacterized protein n=1 Tax=Vagococcus hydrophili TaxID=2714947 RepID=A0A6G8AT86_9ENTE|nr:hypothetical protein [Vagococcus hydrophili]QIL48152.1 hypothetical protein G7082_06445 [Vagococcus hydrophili]